MVLPGRSLETDKYRFGFNGKEFDKEWNAGEMTYDYGFRIYDPRIIRFLSVDPLTAKYPSWSPYPFAMNRPIDGVDLDGLEWKPQRTNSADGKTSTLEVSLQAALFNNSSKAYSQDDINKLVSELKSGFMAWNKSGSIDGVTYQLKVTSIDIKYYPGVKYTDNLATEDPKDMEMKYQGSTHVQVPITIEDPTHPMLEGPNADPSCLKGDLAGAGGMTSLLVSTKFMDRLSNPNGCPNTLNMPCFGTGADCATTQTERTSMHEVGHMMGLKHPGKEGATADDNAVAKSKSNVMHQSSESSGKSVGPSQIRKIVKNPAWNTN